MHPPEAIDDEMVGAFGAHVDQQFVADALQVIALRRLEGRLVALRGVENDAGRLVAARPQSAGRAIQQRIGARLVGYRHGVLNAQAVAVKVVIAILLHWPDVGRLQYRVGRWRREAHRMIHGTRDGVGAECRYRQGERQADHPGAAPGIAARRTGDVTQITQAFDGIGEALRAPFDAAYAGENRQGDRRPALRGGQPRRILTTLLHRSLHESGIIVRMPVNTRQNKARLCYGPKVL